MFQKVYSIRLAELQQNLGYSKNVESREIKNYLGGENKVDYKEQIYFGRQTISKNYHDWKID